MKKQLIYCLLFFPIGLFAQSGEQEVTTTVKEAIVFQNGIQETRQGQIAIPAGKSELKFVGLPNALDPNSIQVKGIQDFTILSVNFQNNYLIDDIKNPQTKVWSDSLDKLQDQLDFVNQMIYVMNEEKSMLRANRKLSNNQGLVVDDLVEISEFSSERIRQIDVKLIGMTNDRDKLTKEIKRLSNQILTAKNNQSKASGEILVNIQASTASKGIIQLSYICNQGGWAPFYDIRSSETGGPISISYKAHVRQTTGSDWDNVKLILSTATPSISNTKPNIPVWYVDFYKPENRIYYQNNTAISNTVYKLEEVSSGSESYSWQNQATLKNNNVNTEFVIPSPYSIPSDGNPYVVEIGTYEFKAAYTYISIPKKNEAAFLMAYIGNWYAYSFLPASSNIYYKGTYVGKSFLDTQTSRDSLLLSLGSDESIVVKRKNVSDMSSKSVTGSSKKQEEKFEISIRNTKSVEIEITLEDQIPVSKQKEISVEAVSVDGANYNKENGKLTWKLKIAPGATKTVSFAYLVKYPKNYIISNL